jgi:hypothetical protein
MLDTSLTLMVSRNGTMRKKWLTFSLRIARLAALYRMVDALLTAPGSVSAACCGYADRRSAVVLM